MAESMKWVQHMSVCPCLKEPEDPMPEDQKEMAILLVRTKHAVRKCLSRDVPLGRML